MIMTAHLQWPLKKGKIMPTSAKFPELNYHLIVHSREEISE